MNGKVKSIFCGLGYVLLFWTVNVLVSFIGGMLLAGVAGAQAGLVAVETGVAPSAEQIMADSLAIIQKYTLHITIVFQILTVFFVWVVCKCKRCKLRVEANMTKFSKNAALWIVVLGVAVAAFMYTFMTLFVPENIMAAYNEVAEASLGGPIAIQLISTVLLAPIMEEIVYRGMVLPRFRKALPTPVAVLLCSVLFGLAHGQIVWITYATVVGLVLSAVAIRENSILASILLHIVFNVIGFGIGYLPLEEVGVMVVCAVSFVAMVAAFVMLFKKRAEEEQTLEDMAA